MVHRFLHVQILPRNGRIACSFCRRLFSRSPAESPRQDTLRILQDLALNNQKAPGNPPPPMTVLRWTISRAFLWVTRLRCKNYF
jgi:hypothetical protein